jgi:Rrf2 family protein
MLLRQDRALTAVAIMADIAFHAGRKGEVTGAADIAERLGAARRGIEPVLQALSRAGLLESVRGPRGGYRLGRPARDVRLDEVVAAIAEETAADPGSAQSGRLFAAVVAPLWRDLDGGLRATLKDLTLDELMRRARIAGLRRPAEEPLDFAI